MTVSIVARDPGTGRFGVATASFVLAVGARVPSLRAGVGAVAVQAGAPLRWGQVVLDELAAGSTSMQALTTLADGPVADGSQLAVVDRTGTVSVRSGGALEREVSQAYGDAVCVAANLMESKDVAAAAMHAFATSTSVFSGRLLEALRAADELGGDVRGRQSAALRVVGDDPDMDLDLRVDDARDPVAELCRLHGVWQAHQLLPASRGPDGLYRNVDQALAALALAPEDMACLGGAALSLLRANDVERAGPLLRRLTVLEPRIHIRLRRLLDAGLLETAAALAALALLGDS